MGDAEELSNEELLNLINENLREIGVDPELIEIEIKKGSEIIVRGEVDSKRQRDLVIQTIAEAAQTEDVNDKLVVLGELSDDEFEEDDPSKENELYDEDNQSVGTEDVFRSVEEGMPYIPPSDPAYQKASENAKKKRKKKKR